jgi:hypothetical protein
MANIKTKDSRQYAEWVELCNQIRNTTSDIFNESDEEKTARITRLKNDFVAFASYYFPSYIKADFGWFHKKAAEEIKNDPKVFAILEHNGTNVAVC